MLSADQQAALLLIAQQYRQHLQTVVHAETMPPGALAELSAVSVLVDECEAIIHPERAAPEQIPLDRV